MKTVALKIQRRGSPRTALNEIGILKAVERHGPCPNIVALHEVFLHDGHICMAYEKHGRALEDEINSRPLTSAETLSVTQQIHAALTHLHAAGFTHTDVKPENILYDRRTGVAKLADLGNAERELATGTTLCTREYTPPEVLLGAPLTPALDFWSLGCTVFEMLTDEVLFTPRTVAAEKYKEFYFDDEGSQEETPATIAADEAAEAAEQYPPGTVIAGKYRLGKVLGRGRFGTVWSAKVISPAALDGTYETLAAHCDAHDAARPPRSDAQRHARTWKKTKGADDLRDLALNYEHLLLIDQLCGPLPTDLIRAGTFKTSFFTPDGKFRHPGKSGPASIAAQLKEYAPRLRAPGIQRFTALIAQLCHVRAEERRLPGALGAPQCRGERLNSRNPLRLLAPAVGIEPTT